MADQSLNDIGKSSSAETEMRSKPRSNGSSAILENIVGLQR
jgi:hypothetical protein